MPYRAVLLDLFDTLLYTTPTENRRKAFALLESLGIDLEDWRRGWRVSYDRALRGRTISLEERVAIALREAGVTLSATVTLELVGLLETRNTPALYDDVHGAITELRSRGYRLGLISNMTTEEKGILEEFGVRALFDVAVTSCDVSLAKPEPAIFLHTAEQLSLAPEECVFVDDQPPYLMGAMAVGMGGVLIRRHNAHDWHGADDIQCALRITELSELLAWLPRCPSAR